MSCSACGIQRVCDVLVSLGSFETAAVGSRYRRRMAVAAGEFSVEECNEEADCESKREFVEERKSGVGWGGACGYLLEMFRNETCDGTYLKLIAD